MAFSSLEAYLHELTLLAAAMLLGHGINAAMQRAS